MIQDLLQLKVLNYHNRTDINIANHYIDTSIIEINKLKSDISEIKSNCNKQFNNFNSRINNAYKKIDKLNKSTHNSINKSNDQDSEPEIETKIIQIGGNNMQGMPPIFPLLSMLGGMNNMNNMNNMNENAKTNELIDSEDEYNENIDIYESISDNENIEDNDIIEIDMKINNIDDLINIGLKYQQIFKENNEKNNIEKNNIENNSEIKNSDEMETTDKIVDDICKKVFSDIFKSKNIEKKEDENEDNDEEKPKKKKKISKIPRIFDLTITPKFNIKNINTNSNSNIDIENNNIVNNNKETKKLNTLIKYFYEYNGKKYAIDIKKIVNLIEPLGKLKKIIGMEKIKKEVIDMILYYIQGFEKNNSDMLHTSIEGPPGVGKTKLGRILAHIFSALEIIPSKRFKRVRRTDLIGKYLGHTAHKTQEVIDEAEGGVLFIDEAYSLGDNDNRDSFSKECIDTINQNLTEKKKKLIVIIAGYSDQLEKTFFSINEGLRRRFPFRFQIEGYNEKELTEIFISKIKKIDWRLNKDITNEYLNDFFKVNKNNFKHFGGDIETLVMNCKMVYSSRVIGKKNSYKKILIKEDINNAYDKFISNKKKTEDIPDSVKHFYS